MLTNPNIPENLETALRAEHPRAALQRLVSLWMENGAERGDLLPALESYRDHLAAASRAEEAELIDELMEGFDGWCVLGD